MLGFLVGCALSGSQDNARYIPGLLLSLPVALPGPHTEHQALHLEWVTDEAWVQSHTKGMHRLTVKQGCRAKSNVHRPSGARAEKGQENNTFLENHRGFQEEGALRLGLRAGREVISWEEGWRGGRSGTCGSVRCVSGMVLSNLVLPVTVLSTLQMRKTEATAGQLVWPGSKSRKQ